MQDQYFRFLFDQINHRSVEATLGVLGIKSAALRQHLRQEFRDPHQPANRLLSDPVFEATYPWKADETTFDQLASTNFLRPSLVKAMDTPPKRVPYNDRTLDLSGQQMKREWHPYRHQVTAWKALQEKQKSLIVTSGTGSGKTECFMVPILNDLVSQSEREGRLEGVQALFLYPLNALISSQKERLMAWTHPFGNKVRYCLYNGNTPHQLNQAIINGMPANEVHDRRSLYNSPPPLLITNPTMLEYMLIRQQDRPILEKSQGKLKYIVLDEAHTYIGSQAAELALLIRRALIGFGVEAKDVRFIATSATIGEGTDAEKLLKQYLADIAGISTEQIELVGGQREIPPLPPLQQKQTQPLAELDALTNTDLATVLPQHPVARSLREYLTENNGTPRTLDQLKERLSKGLHLSLTDQEVLGWLDLLSRKEAEGNTFLPLRGHYFHRTLHGLWACVDKKCEHKSEALKNSDWGFGQVYTTQRTHCECKAPVYEVVFCADCNTEHLEVEQRDHLLVQPDSTMGDEFELEVEKPEEDDNASANTVADGVKKVLGPRNTEHTEGTTVDLKGIKGGQHGKKIDIFIQEEAHCSHCDHHRTDPKDTFRHAYLGMPFYTTTTVPTLLEKVPAREPHNGDMPVKGRNLITFTDSRQGTARIAVKLQQEAERSRIRGSVFGKLNLQDHAQIAALKAQIQALEPVRNIDPNIEQTIQGLVTQLQQLQQNALSWNDTKKKLTTILDISRLMFPYYESLTRDPEKGDAFGKSEENFAEQQLMAQFSRRPNKANSLETLGFVQVYYAGLDKVNEIPPIWQLFGHSLADWKDFLKICLDFYVRENLFVTIPSQYLNWMGGYFSPKRLLPPDWEDKAVTRSEKVWPQFRAVRKPG